MRTEPHKSITTARVDYRYGDNEAWTKLERKFAQIDLRTYTVELPEVLRRVLPFCNTPQLAAYYEHNLGQTSGETVALAVTWVDNGQPRVETGLAVGPEDNIAYVDNTRFQCAVELIEHYRKLMEQALAIQASQPQEAEFVDVVADDHG